MIAALIVLLIGACIWGIYGRIESTVSAQAVAENGRVSCIVSLSDAASVEPGMTIRIGDTEGTVAALESVGDERNGCRFSVEAELPTGVYDAKIVTESITPFSFLVN